MTEELKREEQELLSALSGLESDYDTHKTALDTLQEKIEAVKVDLDGVRYDLLDQFLEAYLTPLLITYTINTDSAGNILLDLSPIAGGELEYDKLQSSLGWIDMDSVPVFYILSYLGKGIPWTSTNMSIYATGETS